MQLASPQQSKALWPQKLHPTGKIIFKVLFDANSHHNCHCCQQHHQHNGHQHQQDNGDQHHQHGGHQYEQDARKMSLVTGPLHRAMASGGHWPHWQLTIHLTPYILHYTH